MIWMSFVCCLKSFGILILTPIRRSLLRRLSFKSKTQLDYRLCQIILSSSFSVISDTVSSFSSYYRTQNLECSIRFVRQFCPSFFFVIKKKKVNQCEDCMIAISFKSAVHWLVVTGRLHSPVGQGDVLLATKLVLLQVLLLLEEQSCR